MPERGTPPMNMRGLSRLKELFFSIIIGRSREILIGQKVQNCLDLRNRISKVMTIIKHTVIDRRFRGNRNIVVRK